MLLAVTFWKELEVQCTLHRHTSFLEFYFIKEKSTKNFLLLLSTDLTFVSIPYGVFPTLERIESW